MELTSSSVSFPPVLGRVAGLSDTDIQKMTWGAAFQKGRKYFHQGRVRSIAWSMGQDRIYVQVAGSEMYDVVIIFQGQLKASCSCPATSFQTCCKHCVCAFLELRDLVRRETTGEVLSGERRKLADGLFSFSGEYEFRQPGILPLTQKQSSEQDQREATPVLPEKLHLFGKKKPASILQIHIQADFEGGLMLNFENSPRPKWGASLLGQNQIPKIFRSLFDDAEKSESVLREFLKRPDREFELWAHISSSKPVRIEWLENRKITLSAGLDLAGNEKITVQRIARVDGSSIDTFARIGKSFFLDIPAGILSPIPELRSWIFVDFLEKKRKRPCRDCGAYHDAEDDDKEEHEEYEDEWDDHQGADDDETARNSDDCFREGSSSFTISLEDFHRTPFAFLIRNSSMLTQDIHFSVEGIPAVIQEIPCRFRVSLLEDEDKNKMKFHLEGKIAENLFSFKRHPILEWFGRGIERGEESYLWKERDKDAAREAASYLVLAHQEKEGQKERNKIMSAALKTFARDRSPWLRTDFSNYLKAFCRFLDDEQEVRQLFVSGGLWHLAVFRANAFLSIAALSGLMLGREVFFALEGKGFRGTVSKRKVMTGLTVLQKGLVRAGAELYFDRHAVHISSLNFAIDAFREGDEQNWFEIHPEIKLDNRLLAQSEWKALLDGGGMRVEDGVIQVIDDNAREILGKLDRFLKTRSSGERSPSKEYVTVPPLEIFDWLALKKLGIQIKLSPEEEERINRLLRFRKLPEKEIPQGFAGTLRDYQKEGYDWLAFLYEHRLGACLADDMGLGKTIQAIAFLAGLKERKVNVWAESESLPHLIVMPASLIFNWESEIEKFYPDLKKVVYAGQERSLECEGKNWDIVLTTYDILRRDIEIFKSKEFHVIIFDETQMVKNLFSARANAVRNLKGRFKICMTGTPLENHLGEYYSVLDLCVPGLYGSLERFKEWMKEDDLGCLIQRARPFILRRTKDAILKELPPKQESNTYLSLTDKQKLLYAKTVEAVRGDIEKAYREKTEAQAKIIALTGMLRLRQICVSPELVWPEWKDEAPKIEFLIAKLQELAAENHAALVFSQFTSCLDILEERLVGEKMGFYRLDGSTPLLKRKDRVESFQKEGGHPIFLISLKAGGFGLNLTRANYVFHLDPWWNPAVDRQASDRAHRIGQEKTVFVQRILMRHTIEEKVMALRNSKWELFQAVMDEETSRPQGGASLSRKDFDFLLSR